MNQSNTSDDGFDRNAAHRKFAIEFNNAAWDLVEAAARTQAETEQMLHLAHAACLHWQTVGTPLNQMRAATLLAFAHAVSGESGLARRFGHESTRLLESLLSEPTSFDRASVAAAMSMAMRSANHDDDSREWAARAREWARTFESADEARLIERLVSLPIDRSRDSRKI
jgi:hypothetical protein